MSVNLTSLKCPECKANLSIEDNITLFYCSYCGTPIMLSNENEQVVRRIDEAGIKRAETEQIIRLKELEIQQARMKQRDYTKRILTNVWIGSIILVIILSLLVWNIYGIYDGGVIALAVFFGVGIPVVGGGAYLIFVVLARSDMEPIVSYKFGIRFPQGYEPFKGKDCGEIAAALLKVGFVNVKTNNMHDLVIGFIHKDGEVDNITVDGVNISSGGNLYAPNVPIRINYHGY